MAIIIRYTHPEVNDEYLCLSRHHGGFVWYSGRLGGFGQAYRFRDEADAQAALVTHKFDLPPLKVTFQPVLA